MVMPVADPPPSNRFLPVGTLDALFAVYEGFHGDVPGVREFPGAGNPRQRQFLTRREAEGTGGGRGHRGHAARARAQGSRPSPVFPPPHPPASFVTQLSRALRAVPLARRLHSGFLGPQ